MTRPASVARQILPGVVRPVIGMVHLGPLPGSVRYAGSLKRMIAAAVADAQALESGGIDALMIENYGDLPFTRGSLAPHTVAAMTAAALAVRSATRLPLGINALRNDPRAALGVALACGASFVRVNVHTGAMLTDQGIIESDAHGTLGYRDMIGSRALILADVHVKHAVPLGSGSIEDAAADTVERGLADGVIVTGRATGAPSSADDIDSVRAAVAAPVLVGSGVTSETITDLLPRCDGVIVGTWLKREGDVDAPVDRARVEALMQAAVAAR